MAWLCKQVNDRKQMSIGVGSNVGIGRVVRIGVQLVSDRSDLSNGCSAEMMTDRQILDDITPPQAACEGPLPLRPGHSHSQVGDE